MKSREAQEQAIVWKDIKGYEGLYQVSNFGQVYSLKRKKYIKAYVDKDGYLRVGLSKNGKQKGYIVHRLVATAYIPNPNNYPMINHRDETRQNNKVSNLEWCTCTYNNNFGTRNERLSKTKKGKKHTKEAVNNMKKAKAGKHIGPNNPNSKKIYCKELDKVFNCIVEANEYLGKSRRSSNITQCVRGKTKTAYEMHWTFMREE
ncbi:NUMOD4 domain-containing protein [Terrisporobacter petrolearius]|uniref:NUMOD4 domain-containing protein n=1 Tax=Terrisporobacter petrolearius TaxID=1460447 RepID=UPI0031CC96A8